LVVITIVFFSLAVLLVRACDTIIGPDEDDLADGPNQVDDLAPPASDEVDPDEVDPGEEPVLAGVAS
jgi:hypothetical protein